jgi:Zn-dependent protease with chaperone function
MAAKRFPADYFDGRSSSRRPVEVEVDGGTARIRGAELVLDVPAAQLRFQPRLGRMPLRIALPDGGILVADADAVAGALAIPPASGIAHRLESHLGVVLASIAGVALAAWLAYSEGIPWLAREVAYRLPPAIESEIATEGLKGLDNYVFKPSALDEARRARLRAVFAQLSGEAEGVGRAARLEFRDGNWIGANALALPGGVVVVTDQLVDMLKDDERVAAVLAHEIGHLEHRHGTRHILQDSITGLLSLAVLGDASAVAGIAATLPTVMLHTSYSRDFEREADRYAYGLLKRTNRSPKLLGDALAELERIQTAKGDGRADSDGAAKQDEKSGGPRSKGAGMGYLSTHPATEERIRAAEEAAR